ncbi:MAG: SDR family oxidoreductase [Deltaproteobacteria bacterium]|nr:SDR family oxidoreductase [Deltaproteobacteria bacterium]
MDLGIKDKIALVAASSKGLGRACAEAIASEGAKVVICARDADILSKTQAEIAAVTGSEILAIPADLTRADHIKTLVQKTIKRFGGLHILVTNAGGPPPGSFINFEDGDWQSAFELSMMSAVRLIRAAIPHMQREKWGRIINITSLSVKEPLAPLVLSNAIRPSVHGLAKTLANEYGADGITINNVMPGYTQTDRLKQIAADTAKNTGASTDSVLAEMGKPVPLGRIGQPEEFGAVVAFLASEKASYITGTSIPVDGGAIRAAF